MLDALLERFKDPMTVAIPVLALLMFLEYLEVREDQKHAGYDKHDTRANVLTGLGAMLIAMVLRVGTLVLYTWIYTDVAPVQHSAGSPLAWALVFVGGELMLYLYHRVSHRTRILWAAHQVHHSSTFFNLSTALRRKWAQWFAALSWAPLAFLGVPPVLIFTMNSIQLLYGFAVHTEAIGRLHPFIEAIFVTPSHHRVHHGVQKKYHDKNYGSILIVFDRAFGTFQAEEEKVRYGIGKDLNGKSVLWLQFHELVAIAGDVRRAEKLSHRLGYVFGPPGWKPSEKPLERTPH